MVRGDCNCAVEAGTSGADEMDARLAVPGDDLRIGGDRRDRWRGCREINRHDAGVAGKLPH
jgi:hypothetical protein